MCGAGLEPVPHTCSTIGPSIAGGNRWSRPVFWLGLGLQMKFQATFGGSEFQLEVEALRIRVGARDFGPFGDSAPRV